METLNKVLRHPLAVLGGWLFGIVLAIVFFFQSIERPEITSFVHPVRTTVVRADAASALTVVYRGAKLASDVSAAQVAFWNAGNKAVRQGDVLEPFVIQVGGNTPILEARVRKTSRPLAKVELDQSQLAKGRLGVSWSILEEGDGAVIQLTYAGSVDAPIHVTGAVVGQKSVVNIVEKRFLKRNGSESPVTRGLAVAASALFIGWILLPIASTSLGQQVLMRDDSGRIVDRDPPRSTTPWVRRLVWLISVLIVTYTYWIFTVLPGPPFGF